MDIILPCPPYDPLCGPGPGLIIPDPADTATVPDQSWAALLFGNDLLDPGGALTIDLFENSASDTLFLSQSFAGGGTRTLLTDSSSGWSDFQGVARVTMNQGTAELDGLNVFVIQNGVGYQGSAVVPEPSTLSFALAGGIAAIVAGLARRFRRRDSRASL